MIRTTAVLFLAASAPALAGDSIVQTIAFDWDAEGDWRIGAFDAFDNAGGTRELTDISFELDANATWGVTALNYTDVGFEADEWFAEGISNFNVLFGDIGPGSVERISGVVAFPHLTGVLGAGSGSPFAPPGDPSVSATFTGDIGSTHALTAAEFQAFTGDPVDARILGFTDVVIDGPNGAPGIISVNTDVLTATGSLTLTYTYRNVPTPATLAFLPIMGSLAVRRRR